MIIFCGFVLVMTLIIWNFFTRDQRKVKLAKQFEGPWAFPLIGNLYLYLNKKPEDILPFLQKLYESYGDTFRIWAGQRLVIISKNPRYLEIILSSQKNLTKNNMYTFLIDWLGTGLLISTGRKWHTRRKITTPAFHFNILQQFVEVFNHQNQIFIEKLKKNEIEKPFDVYDCVTLMSFDIICETAMGVKLNAQLNENSDYVKAVKEISYIIISRVMNIWWQSDFIFSFTKSKRRHDVCLRIIHDFSRNIVKRRRETLLSDSDANREEISEENFDGIKKKSALLDVLLKAKVDGKPLQDEEIAEEVDTFMFGGHDTVTSAISFALYLISQHPEVQTKVYDEVMMIVGENLNVFPTYHQLQEMKFTENCIKETLRLYPPVPMYGRNLDEDVDLDGKIVPAGSNFNVSVINLNKDPKYFRDPDLFIPERFDEIYENPTENPFIFVPFSAGPRNCIGQKFAMLELKSTICNIVRNFELIPGKIKPKLLTKITLKSSNGIHVGFKKRSALS